jgi:hypothetical protein
MDQLNFCSLSLKPNLQSCCAYLLLGQTIKDSKEWISYGIFAMALDNCHNDCFKQAFFSGFKWNSFITSHAAFLGNLEMLRFAYVNGCEWDRLTTASAAYGGHLNCLRYAYTMGCAWNVETCNNAAVNGHFQCLLYAINNGCPVTEYTLNLALTFECFEVILKKLKPHLFKNKRFNAKSMFFQ